MIIPKQMTFGFSCEVNCARWRALGSCVHVSQANGKSTTFDRKNVYSFIKERNAAKKAEQVRLDKLHEKDDKWHVVAKEDWKQMPFTYGVYIWVDVKDRLLMVSKAADFRRRHFTWISTRDKRFDAVAKIWWLHTGWYNEILAALDLLPLGSVITLTLLEEVLMLARPIESLLPEPPSS